MCDTSPHTRHQRCCHRRRPSTVELPCHGTVCRRACLTSTAARDVQPLHRQIHSEFEVMTVHAAPAHRGAPCTQWAIAWLPKRTSTRNISPVVPIATVRQHEQLTSMSRKSSTCSWVSLFLIGGSWGRFLLVVDARTASTRPTQTTMYCTNPNSTYRAPGTTRRLQWCHLTKRSRM